MDNLFNFKRMGLLLRADWMENQRKVTYVIGTLLTCFVFYTLFTHFVMGGNTKGDAFYTLSMVGLFLYICQYVNRKIHIQSGNYLLVPANNEEKFVTLILEGFLLLTSFTITFVLLCAILNLIIGHQEWFKAYQIMNMNSRSLIGIPVLIISLIFLSYVTFRKYPLLMVALGFLSFILLILAIMYVLTQISDLTNFDRLYFNSLYFHNALNILRSSFNPALLAFTAVTLYIAYLKLKEKELR